VGNRGRDQRRVRLHLQAGSRMSQRIPPTPLTVADQTLSDLGASMKSKTGSGCPRTGSRKEAGGVVAASAYSASAAGGIPSAASTRWLGTLRT
jgi:hypothetical protein